MYSLPKTVTRQRRHCDLNPGLLRLSLGKTKSCMADSCTKFEVSSVSRWGEITRGVKF